MTGVPTQNRLKTMSPGLGLVPSLCRRQRGTVHLEGRPETTRDPAETRRAGSPALAPCRRPARQPWGRSCGVSILSSHTVAPSSHESALDVTASFSDEVLLALSGPPLLQPPPGGARVTVSEQEALGFASVRLGSHFSPHDMSCQQLRGPRTLTTTPFPSSAPPKPFRRELTLSQGQATVLASSFRLSSLTAAFQNQDTALAEEA